MRRQTDKPLRQYRAVSAAMSGLEAVVVGLRLEQVLIVMSCVLSFVSATTFQQHAPAGILHADISDYKTVILSRVSPLGDRVMHSWPH